MVRDWGREGEKVGSRVHTAPFFNALLVADMLVFNVEGHDGGNERVLCWGGSQAMRARSLSLRLT